MSQEKIDFFIKADIYRTLSKGFSYPDKKNVDDMRSIMEELSSASHLGEDMSSYISMLLTNIDVGEMEKEYSRLFLKGTIPTCESSYVLRFDVIPSVSAFYAAFGVIPKTGEAPDSLPYELEFLSILSLKMALALSKDDEDVTKCAYNRFLKEHMSEFVKTFSEKVVARNPKPFYKVLTELLGSFINKEIEDAKVQPDS
ncbi:MAG: molecular chaperone TorD family protein [Candidatus Caldarchaeum sp.]